MGSAEANLENQSAGHLVLGDVSGRVIAAAVEVHKRLGPGFVESVYENALKLELSKRGIAFEAQKKISVLYDGEIVGTHVLDILVEQRLILELKAVKTFEDVHLAQLRSYLRATGCKVGLLLNFNVPALQVKRVIN